MTRVGRSCALGRRDELISRAVQPLDLPLDLDQVPLKEFGHVTTGRLTIFSHFEDRGNLRQGEPSALRVANESKTFLSFLTVIAVAIRHSGWVGNQADSLVVPNGLGRHPRSPGQFSDLHIPAL